MSDTEQQEFEIIPATLGVTTIMSQVMNYRDFLLKIGVEHCAKLDGIVITDGWKLDIAKGLWFKPKEKVSDATNSDANASSSTGGESVSS